jgi:hypothetical protein
MRRILLGAVALTLASVVSANDVASRSDVEARLDALEAINVTAQKAAKVDNEAPDAELDAILQAATRAETEGVAPSSELPLDAQ